MREIVEQLIPALSVALGAFIAWWLPDRSGRRDREREINRAVSTAASVCLGRVIKMRMARERGDSAIYDGEKQSLGGDGDSYLNAISRRSAVRELELGVFERICRLLTGGGVEEPAVAGSGRGAQYLPGDRKPRRSAVAHEELVREAYAVFAGVARPEHFTDHRHCDECAEHDATLRSYAPDTIPREALGHPGWDPMTFATDAGFRYYAPALLRTALTSAGDACYVEQLLSQVIRDGPRNSRWHACTPAERAVVVKALNALLEERLDELSVRLDGDRLMQAIDIWSDTGADGAHDDLHSAR